MGKRRERKQTITQQIMAVVYDKLASHEHDLTRKQYARQTKQFVKFCRENFNARTFEECAKYIQSYSDYLQGEGYAASTIHTYLASVCSVFDTNLGDISKPVRHTADYVRGRNNTLTDVQNDLDNPRWAYIVDFQRCVGLRREELMRLRGQDLKYDESGQLCVWVRKGKGGKSQFQRILPEDEPFVRAYFENIASAEHVFGEKYFKNDLNFHSLRAEAARTYYTYLLRKMEEDPSYRNQLEQEIRNRWQVMNLNKNGKPKAFLNEELYGTYALRGKNRILAKKRGLALHYDKTALLATSIFKLSHWRNDVTVASLKGKTCVVVCGRISQKYFCERLYC